jgi:hypothetical protein
MLPRLPPLLQPLLALSRRRPLLPPPLVLLPLLRLLLLLLLVVPLLSMLCLHSAPGATALP